MSSDVADFVAQVEAAVRQATGAIGAAGLQVSSIEVSIETFLKKEAGGSLKLEVVELGASVERDRLQKIQVEFKPRVLGLYAGRLDQELTEAVQKIELAVAEAAESFALSGAQVTLRLGKTSKGEVKVFLGGSAESGQVHEATIKLTPVGAVP
jgi:hypothetical protein